MDERSGARAPGTRTRRGSRFWLFAPFVAVALVIVAWSVAWFLIRDRVAVELDEALGVEAAIGRGWTCADRSIAGFPFRIEISCATLRLRSEDGLALDLGPARAVAQIYQPRHVIVTLSGPLLVDTPDGAVSADWTRMEASIRNLGRGTEQLAIVAEGPRATIDAAALPASVEAAAERVSLYARPSPGTTRADGALDLVVQAQVVTAPALDAALGAASPADIEAQLRATGLGAALAARSDPRAAVEAWRAAGGRIDVELFSVMTPTAALSVAGELGLDASNRPEGRIEASGRGLGPLVSAALGGRGGFMADAIVAALGGAAEPAQGSSEPAALRPLPPVRLQDGRVFVGPLPAPITLQPVF